MKKQRWWCVTKRPFGSFILCLFSLLLGVDFGGVIRGLRQVSAKIIFVLGGFWFGGLLFIGAIVFIYRTKDIFCVEGYDFSALWGIFSGKIFVACEVLISK